MFHVSQTASSQLPMLTSGVEGEGKGGTPFTFLFGGTAVPKHFST